MSTGDPSTESLPSEIGRDLDDIVERFEKEWQAGQRPSIDSYLPADSSGRAVAVKQLVNVELECRLKAGEPARVEEYLSRYPELAEQQAVVLEIIAREYLLRRRRGESVRPDEYVRRFAQYLDGLVRSTQGYLDQYPARGGAAVLELIAHDYLTGQRDDLTPQEYLRRFETRLPKLLKRHLVELLDRPANENSVSGGEWITTGLVTRPRPVEPPTPVAPVSTWSGAQDGSQPGAEAPTQIPDKADAAAANADTVSSSEVDKQTWPIIPGYEIVAEIGRGGMGRVYKARQVRLNRFVAIKMILAGKYATPDEMARFRREAETVARLQHAHIIQIIEMGDYEGEAYVVFEYVEGGTLAQKTAGIALPPAEAARLVEILARAVNVAHQRGVLHRDLKPGNILIDSDGMPKITDFGLAKHLDAVSQRTPTGAILGTAGYIAPEQADGLGRPVGPAADIYSLGAILYELLTGRPPFRGPTPLETMLQAISKPPTPPGKVQPGVPRELEAICLRCLEKEPARRYQTAGELAADLHRWLTGEPVRQRPSVRKRTRLVPRYAWLIAATVLIVVLVGWLVALRGPVNGSGELREVVQQEEPAGHSTATNTEVPARRELPPAATNELRNRLASVAKDIINAVDYQPISIGVFTPRKLPPSNSGLPIEQTLKLELEAIKQGIVVQPEHSIYEIKGDYEFILSHADPSLKEIEIVFHVIESKTGDEKVSLKTGVVLRGSEAIAEVTQRATELEKADKGRDRVKVVTAVPRSEEITAAPVPAELRNRMTALAKGILAETKNQPVSIAEFRPQGWRIAGIDKLLEAELQALHRGIVQEGTPYEIKGEYNYAANPTNPAIRHVHLACHIFDASTGKEKVSVQADVVIDTASIIRDEWRERMRTAAIGVLARTNWSPVSIGQFARTARAPGNIEFILAALLKMELENAYGGVVQDDAPYEIKGDYVVVADSADPAADAVKFVCRLIQASTGEEVMSQRLELRTNTKVSSELIKAIIARHARESIQEPSTATAQRREPRGKRYALLVGVNRYDNRNLANLEYAERDMQELAVALRHDYQIRLLFGDASGRVRATKANIDAELDQLFGSGLHKDDTVLVALVGHGQQMVIEQSGQRPEEPFFCPRDAVPGDPSTLISLSRLCERLAQRGGGTNLLLVDACRTSPDPTRGRGIDGDLALNLPAGMAIFLSCSKAERAYESERAGGGHGLFFHFVIEGLRNETLRNAKGDLSWERLVAYVRDKFDEEAPKLVGESGRFQTPHVLANLSRSPVVLTSKSLRSR